MLHILIVDDLPANLYSLEQLLLTIQKDTHMEIIITKAQDGAEALAIAFKKEIDLIILDIQMPVMDGFETAKYLQENQKTRNIPIIFLTAIFKSEEFIKNGFDIGAIDYLMKPIEKSIFSKKIKSYLIHLTKQKKILQSSKIFEDFSSKSDLLQIILNSATKIVYFNHTIEEVFPTLRLEIPIYDFINSLEDMTIEEKESFIDYLNTLHLLDGENEIPTLTYKGKYYKPSFIPVKDQYLLSLKDITSEVELKNQHTKLKENYTTDLEHTKEKLLMIFTHEFKTPLNGIIGFSSHITRVLQKQPTPQKIQRCLSLSQKVESLGKILLSDVNSLLDLAKLKDGKIEFRYQRCSLKAILENFYDIYMHIYKDTYIEIDAKNIIINTDKSMITHIFENIMTNGIKYGKSKILVNLYDDGEYFYFTVEDDGAGISDTLKGKIFDLFEQGNDQLLTRDESGTGIGLHLVKKLSDSMGYQICIEDSQKLGGAKFIVKGKLVE